MSEITILKMGDDIIVPVQEELHDKAAMRLQEMILQRIEETEAKGLLIDISSVSIVDSFLARLMGDTSRMARLMGVETVLVGMKKEVVVTLIELGMVLTGIHTALNIEEGLEYLKQKRQESEYLEEGHELQV
ncbi:STAS domain-containing protein [Geomonas sp. RF6]|uniref:STAS domain-containing protein n=1 Tax=Geomonas sp. RF6 TaxID=2897342 RepID=UPI001E632F4E|nr:STAS domain-containing protein [Geomonas sp. RF6]UFS69757.1 STAS domain-containing protein [Geomonas sp. RF6]